MEAKKLSNEFMQHSAESAAWGNISSDYPLTESMLEKYSDKLDWDEVSQNRYINWSVPMLDKFKKKLNWKSLSDSIDEDVLTPSVIESFKDYWDWDNLSDRAPLTEDLLIAYSNRWNWSRIINHYGRCETFEGRGISFYEQFKDYIPEAKLQDSSLWNEIVEQTKKQIINDIVVKG